MISLKLSRPTPPLPMSLLKSLIPITMFESSHSYATFSGVVRATKGLKPALGSTDSRAAATSLSIVFEVAVVSWMLEQLPIMCCLFLYSKQLKIFLQRRVIPSKSLPERGSKLTISSMRRFDSCDRFVMFCCLCTSCFTQAESYPICSLMVSEQEWKAGGQQGIGWVTSLWQETY